MSTKVTNIEEFKEKYPIKIPSEFKAEMNKNPDEVINDILVVLNESLNNTSGSLAVVQATANNAATAASNANDNAESRLAKAGNLSDVQSAPISAYNIEAQTGISPEKYTGTDLAKLNSAASYSNTNNVPLVLERGNTYDLDGGTFTIPANTKLKFSGGTIANGTITGNNTLIDAGVFQIFGSDVTIAGTWNVGKAYFEWFGSLASATTNFIILRQLLVFNTTIIVKQNFSLEAASLIDSITTDSKVHIEGTGNTKPIITLNTRHSAGYAYIKSENGNNIILNNIELRTSDWGTVNNTLSRRFYFVGYRYATFQFLQWIDLVNVENCDIKGNLSILFFNVTDNTSYANDAEFNATGVNKIICRNNNYFECYRVFDCVNQNVNSIISENEVMKEIRDSTYWININGIDANQIALREANQTKYIFQNLQATNTTIQSENVGYLCAALLEGKHLLLENCYVEGLITDTTISEAIPFYKSCAILEEYNCQFINNFCAHTGGNNSFLYFKGAKNIKSIDCTYKLTKQGLVNAGLIADLDVDMTAYTPICSFRFSQQEQSLTDYESCLISNITFDTEIINNYSVFQYDDFKISGTVRIVNLYNLYSTVGKSNPRSGAFISGARFIENQKQLTFKNVDFYISYNETGRFIPFYNILLNNGSNTIVSSWEMVIFENLNFYVNDTEIEIPVLSADFTSEANNRIFGNNSGLSNFGFGTNDVNNKPQAQRYIGEWDISDLSQTTNYGYATFNRRGELTIKVRKNNLTSYKFFTDLLVNIVNNKEHFTDDTPYYLDVDFSYKLKDGSLGQLKYKLGLRQRRLYYVNDSDKADADGIIHNSGSVLNIHPTNKETDSTIKLNGTTVTLNAFGYLSFDGISDVESFQIIVKTGILRYNSGTALAAAQAYRQLNYDKGEYQTGTASPVSSVVPHYIGQEFLETTTPKWYKATGLTNADWV